MEYNLKKIKKSLFVTLLVFTVPALSIFPSTNSKYISERNDWLQYTTNMKSIRGQSQIQTSYLSSSSSYEKVGISFTFPKSDNALSTDVDIYRIKVNNKCTIDPNKITSKGKKTKLSNSEYQIEYPAGASEDTITVEYSCNYQDILEESEIYLKDTIYVTESFNDEGYYYDYMKGYFKKSYSEYREQKPIPTAIRNGNVLTIPKNVENKYNEVKSWLVDYFSDDTNNYIYESYYNSVYNDTNYDDPNLLLDGFTVEKKTDETLVYTIEKNYKNYALTKNASSSSTYKYFYFIGDEWTEEDANNLFKYYLDKYGYSKDSDEYNKIIKYVIDKKGGIKKFMVTPNLNKYIKWDDSSKTIIIPSLIELLELIDSPSGFTKQFTYNDSNNMISSAATLIKRLPESSIIDSNGNEILLSGDFDSSLQKNTELFNFLRTKHTQPKSLYISDGMNKYFHPADTNVILLLRAFSNGVDTNGVEIILVEDGKDYNLEFTTSDTYESVNEILGIVKENLSITETEWNSVITNAGDVTVPIEGKNLTITKTGTKININVTNTNTPATVSEPTEPTEPTNPTDPTDPSTETDTGETNTNEVEVNNTN